MSERDRLRCTRCDMRGEKWVTHTTECYAETRRIATDEFGKIEREPAMLGEVLIAAMEAAKEGGNTFGFLGGGGLRIAQQLLELRGLPTGEPEIEELVAAGPSGEGR